MSLNFKCKNCGQENEISEALTHQIEEQVLLAERSKHQTELEQAKRDAEEKVQSKLKAEYEVMVKDLRESSLEEKERNRNYLKLLEESEAEKRQLRRKDEERELEMKRKIADEEEKIRNEARKKVLEEQELKDKEKDKKLSDALKQIEEMKVRIQQGSQQTQGEVLELELEELLKKEFPLDLISEVKKGQRGADIMQEVVDRNGKKCGTILWESKNGKWTTTWIDKLKEDQRQANAHIAVLVVTDPPPGLESFMYKDGIWVVTRKMTTSLALALRYNLVKLNFEKLVNTGKNEKMEVLYGYITSMDFRHRIEAIVDAFGGMQEEIEREKRWFTTKWARQEKQLRRIVDNTQGLYGDLQGVIGKSLPEIQTLQVDSPSDLPLLQE
jgi:hypothetical protein